MGRQVFFSEKLLHHHLSDVQAVHISIGLNFLHIQLLSIGLRLTLVLQLAQVYVTKILKLLLIEITRILIACLVSVHLNLLSRVTTTIPLATGVGKCNLEFIRLLLLSAFQTSCLQSNLVCLLHI